MDSFKIVLIGAPQVGKSTFLTQFLGSNSELKLREGKKRVLIDGIICEVDIVVLSDSSLSSVLVKHNLEADGYLLLFGMDNVISLLSLDNYIQAIQILNDHKSVPMLIAGNKTDLEKKLDVDIVRALLSDHKVPFVETSSWINFTVEKAIFCLVREMKKARLLKKPKVKHQSMTCNIS